MSCPTTTIYKNKIFLNFFQNDAVLNLKKARSLYVTRQQEYEKARESSQKGESDKKKKVEEDAMHKVRLYIASSVQIVSIDNL